MLFFGGGLQSPRRRSREKSILLTIILVVGIYFVFYADGSGRRVNQVSDEEVLRKYHASHPESKSSSYHQHTDPDPIAQMDMVVASMKKDNTSWLYEYFPDWHKSIYVVDDPSADLTVAHNKGRESMVYLT